MQSSRFASSLARGLSLLWATLLVVAVFPAIAGQPASAQTIFGSLSNFDVFNDTGQETHGFEIELDGISSTDITYTFGGTYIRYGDPTKTDFAGGVFVRYESPYDGTKFTKATPLAPNPITPTGGHACWTGGVPPAGAQPYLTAGCEHFGLGLTKNPTNTVYRWLIADPAVAGHLVAFGTNVSIPAPVWVVVPNPIPANPPVVQAVVQAEPAEVGQLFGKAKWVKVFVTESANPAILHHLVTDDPAVPGAAEVETEWAILQEGAGNAELLSEGQIGAAAESVTRRYEFYEYTGAFTAEGEVLCGGDGTCTAPLPGELGNYIGAQMAAVNLAGAVGPLALAASPLPSGEEGIVYAASLVTGGTPPYTFTVLKGALPAGLSPDPGTGDLGGTPAAPPKNQKFTLQVMDSAVPAASVTGALKVTIYEAVHVSTPSLKSGKVGKNYKTSVKAQHGIKPYTWSLIGGALPAGFTFDVVKGQISGVPGAPGVFPLTFQVTDALGAQAQDDLTLTIN